MTIWKQGFSGLGKQGRLQGTTDQQFMTHNMTVGLGANTKMECLRGVTVHFDI